MKLNKKELKEFLEEKTDKYNRPFFIESDPISIPHQFNKKEDIEIAGFLAATIAWGQRVTILKNSNKLMQLMDNSPHEFIIKAGKKDLKRFEGFVHRTFNSDDLKFFILSLQNIYRNEGGLEKTFSCSEKKDVLLHSITNFRNLFFTIPHLPRTTKHVSNPMDNSSAKRICMFLRWMARKDKRGVDFGIWKLDQSQLMCPLDVHSGNVGRKLGLLKRTQNDWKAVEELTTSLRQIDASDPVKYDFALFGLGVFEKF
ncbi:MAG: hypothetical protein K0S44_3420 [Bacteroidetes bacterium]|jgi:uncharacterized protein (TIGR02757 family)|nr:hypothetical protein [Bacteroidota bacterium]